MLTPGMLGSSSRRPRPDHHVRTSIATHPSVVHNNQLMQDDEDLAFKFSQLMSTMRLQSLYGFPPRGMVLNLEMPKRYMDIYPKPQFLM